MIYDLIIIGGGPAGVTAAIYAARQRLKTVLITKDFSSQISKKAVMIENYPGFPEISGIDLIEQFKKHLEKFEKKGDIDIRKDTVLKIKKQSEKFLIKTTSNKSFQSKTVIVASGADPRPLEIKGEKKYIGKGVSYCATCDAAFFSDKIVAVIGGGNTGFEAAIALSNWAKKVYILEYGSIICADKVNQEIAQKTGKIEIITNSVLKEIKGNQFVNSILYFDKKENKEKELAVEGVFVEIGTQPATSFVRGLVEFNERDEIKVNPFTGETSMPGIFAAGDADDVPYKQIVIAAGEGAKAALSVCQYIKKRIGNCKNYPIKQNKKEG
ncbi:MAG TPA: FAD-dependent oxidoreductase [Candidatus Pacearchaeota archaeon]|nr:FAD-dependent oxidoreductase [Candidatus Pacearchaeota archaeon]HQD89141.1 FAD-dependent oxidoreductase [Candidatus Pacearchaeota archaeon]